MSVASVPKRSLIQGRQNRTLHQAMLARAMAEQKPEVVDVARRALADLERVFPPDPRMDRLAQRLSLDSEQVAFVWATVACSVDNPLVADGLLLETEDVSPASPRLASFLAGDDSLPAPLLLAQAPPSVLHDPKQLAALLLLQIYQRTLFEIRSIRELL